MAFLVTAALLVFQPAPEVRHAANASPDATDGISVSAPTCGADACAAEVPTFARGPVLDGTQGGADLGILSAAGRRLYARGRSSTVPRGSVGWRPRRSAFFTYRATAPPRAV